METIYVSTSSSSLSDLGDKKSLIKVIDILGRNTASKGICLEIYDDGTTKKQAILK